MREQYKKELFASLMVGNLITLLIFALTRDIYINALDIIITWLATWFISTYGVWTIITVAQKGRDAWQSNHGRRMSTK